MGNGGCSPSRFGLQKDLLSVSCVQDAFDLDKGQKSAISGCRLHYIFWIIFSGFFPFSAGYSMQVSKEIEPKRREKCPISGPRKMRRVLSRLCFGPDILCTTETVLQGGGVQFNYVLVLALERSGLLESFVPTVPLVYSTTF